MKSDFQLMVPYYDGSELTDNSYKIREYEEVAKGQNEGGSSCHK